MLSLGTQRAMYASLIFQQASTFQRICQCDAPSTRKRISSECCVRMAFSVQMAHWRAHEQAVSSIDTVLIADRDPLLLTCSTDTRVSLWTTRGGLIGHFGVDVWRLDDPSTWKDPNGEKSCAPISDRSDYSDEVCLVPIREGRLDITRSRIFC